MADLTPMNAAIRDRGPAHDSVAERHAEQAQVDRSVLLITVMLWLTNFAIVMSRSAAIGTQFNWTGTSIRFAISAMAAAICFSIHLAFRGRVWSPLKRFMVVGLLFVPISAFISLVNEYLWFSLTDYYTKTYSFSLANVLANQCVGPKGCAPFYMEIIYTEIAMIWICIAWTAVYVSAITAAAVRNRDRRLAVAEATAHRAQLAALRFQLNPHFLFNALNTLSGLIALDRKVQAEQTLMNLSDFLRRALRRESRHVVSLLDEIAGEQMYLDIERARFGDRLKVVIDIQPECETAAVPVFILQPLVENSIKYAVARTERAVVIAIRGRCDGNTLELVVENSEAQPPSAHSSDGFGIGLDNVRDRLSALYGEQAALEVRLTNDHRWVNRLTLPFERYSEDDESIDR